MTHYDISADTVNLLLNWGAIMSWPGIPLTMFLAKQKGGLRVCILVASSLTFACTVLRLIPEWAPSIFLAPQGGSNAAGMMFVHLGHILVSLAGPLVMSTPAQLAQIWYGDNERATATAVGSVANNSGVALAFLIGPAIVAGDPNRIPGLLYCHFVLSAVSLVLICTYFPARPAQAPSLTAALQTESERKRELYEEHKAERLRAFEAEQESRTSYTRRAEVLVEEDVVTFHQALPGADKAVFNPYAVLDLNKDLARSATLSPDVSSSFPAASSSARHYSSGAFNPYTLMVVMKAKQPKEKPLDPVPEFNVLDISLEDIGQSFLKSLWTAAKQGQFMLLAFAGGVTTGSFNAWSGLLDLICHPLGLTPEQSGYLGFAVTVSSIVGGLFVVQLAEKYFLRHFKRLLLYLMACVLLSFIWFTFSVPFDEGAPVIPYVYVLLLICISIAGFFQGAAQPLFCELAVELTYPMSETTSVGMIGLWGNVAASIVLSIPAAQSHWLNAIMCAIIGVSLLSFLCVKEQYKRLDAGNPASEEEEQSQ